MAKPDPWLASGREPPSAGLSFTGIFPFLSGLGVIVGLLYSLGLTVLSLRINERVHNFSTAWYAASLVPNKVVLGQGVKLFFTPLVLPALVFLVIGMWMTLTRARAGQHAKEEPATTNFWTRLTRPMEARFQLQDSAEELSYIAALWKYFYTTIFSVEILILIIYYLMGMLLSIAFVYVVQGHLRLIHFMMTDPYGFLVIQLAAMLSVISIFVIAYIDSRRRVHRFWRLLKVLFVVYLFAIVLGAVEYRYTMDLPLPKVTVETTIPGQPVIDGRLLTYVQPYWYILHDINDRSNIVVIPTDRVRSSVIH